MNPSIAEAVRVDTLAADTKAKEAAKEATDLAGQIKAAVEKIEAIEGIEAETKSEYLDYLSKANQWLENAQECAAKTVQYNAEADEAPALLSQAKAQLDQTLPKPVPQPASDATLAQLEQTLNEAEEQLKAAEEELTEKNKTADAKARADRKAKIAEQIEAAEDQVGGI